MRQKLRDSGVSYKICAGKRAAFRSHRPVPTMLRWKSKQRAVLVGVLPPLANLGFAALILGQVISDGPFSWTLAIAGLLQWIVLVLVAVGISGVDEP
jgi:hypothetical protein